MKKIPDYIKNLIKHRDKAISKKIKNLHPYDIAQIFHRFSFEERNFLYENLPASQFADILSYLDTEETIEYLNELGIDKSVPILEEMSADDITDILNEIDNEDFREILGKFNTESQIELAYLRKYREDQVGAIMTTNYIATESDVDVRAAMKTLIGNAADSETIDPVYITEKAKLVGVVNLVDLIKARSPKTVDDIYDRKVISVKVTDQAALAVNKMNDYGISALPVTDNGYMVGIITIDDAMDVIEKEETETYGHFAAVSMEDDNLLTGTLRRIPWLLSLLILGFFVSSLISVYEGAIKQVTTLVFFQTLILDMVGNISTQSLAVSIRHLVRDDLDSGKRIARHIYKEFKIAFVNSLVCGILAFLTAFIMLYFLKSDNKAMIALVVGISILISLIIGGLFGAIIPIIFSKIKIDPALASGPLITTLDDIVGVIIYFSVAAALLNLV